MIAHGPGPLPGTRTVTFVVVPRPEHLGGAIAVVGDFNGWDPTAHLFTPGIDHRWRATVVLPVGRRHAFRYLAQNGDWFDEPDADERRPDAAGRVNCILDLTGIEDQRPQPAHSPQALGGLPLAAAP